MVIAASGDSLRKGSTPEHAQNPSTSRKGTQSTLRIPCTTPGQKRLLSTRSVLHSLVVISLVGPLEAMGNEIMMSRGRQRVPVGLVPWMPLTVGLLIAFFLLRSIFLAWVGNVLVGRLNDFWFGVSGIFGGAFFFSFERKTLR